MTAAARARAHANIALVKYWGKRDSVLNLPAVGSVSVTLADLWTETEVLFADELESDAFELNGRCEAEELGRVERFLDNVRQRAGVEVRARVVSQNNFPTAAGLASSASGFAALALASARASGLVLTESELCVLARRGSGSAPRSLFGGFVEMSRGERKDGTDAIARPLFDADHWPLEVLVVVTSESPKDVGSSSAMERSARTSPFYDSWVRGSEEDLAEARAAIGARDLERLGTVAERSCLKMHAVAQAAQPGVLYWNAATMSVVHAVRAERAKGTPWFFTIDAGPQVKVFCEASQGSELLPRLAQIPGIERVLHTGLGPDARVLD